MTQKACLLIKNTALNMILACVGGKVYLWVEVIIFFAEIGDHNLLTQTFCKFGTPFQRKCQPPLQLSIWNLLALCGLLRKKSSTRGNEFNGVILYTIMHERNKNYNNDYI